MADMDRIAILGAGSGGAMTANLLRRKLDRDEAEITVIDKSDEHFYQPSFYLIPFGYMYPEDQHRPMDEILNDGVEFVHDEVTGVDPDAEVVECAGTEVDYDYLIVSTGHTLEEEATPGMKEGWEETDSVYPYYNFEAAVEMQDAIEEFDGGTFLVTVPDTPIKCGGAPLKMTMLAEDYMDRKGIRDDCEFIMAKPSGAVFGVEPYKQKLEEIWDNRDIQFEADFSVEEVDYENQVVKSGDGREIEYDLYAPVSPQFGVDAITEGSPLTNGGEYVDSDKYTMQHNDYDNVFAIGDGSPAGAAKTAAAARKESHVVVKNLIAEMNDEPMRAEYDGYAACPLLTGKNKAMVAEFSYDESISAPIETRMNWIMDINVIPPMYWDMWMRGYDPVP